jgi:hypothetical protein
MGQLVYARMFAEGKAGRNAVERLRNAVGYVKRLERHVAKLQALNFQSTC